MKNNALIIILALFSLQIFGSTSSLKPIKVLFIGNSLTYTNDLPKLVKEEALSTGFILKTTMVAFPNYAIVDHWNEGKIQRLIAKYNYDFVIVQQGPSSQQEGRKMLFNDGSRLQQLCKENNARLVYFMVWPSKTYYYSFDDVIKNHIEAAKANNALLAPVGAVWKVHFDKTGDYSYYGNDGFHPSIKGSKIAAKVIAATILNPNGKNGDKN